MSDGVAIQDKIDIAVKAQFSPVNQRVYNKVLVLSKIRYSACALLMFFCLCSYCWMVRRGTPEISDNSR